MLKNLKTHKILWVLLASLSVFVAGMGVFNHRIYNTVVINAWLPGTIAQDAITIIAGIILLFLSFKITETAIKGQIMAVSLVAYMFYAYGIYSIEQLYNTLYLFYMAIFGLSFWSIVYSLLSIKPVILQQVQMPVWVKNIAAGALIFIALLFYALWTGQLLPLMQTGEKIEFAYSIFILDMAFVLPTLIITAGLIIKKYGLGLILAPILFVKAFTLLFSVGLGGFIKPLFNEPRDVGETAFYFILSFIFLGLAILSLWKMEFQENLEE